MSLISIVTEGGQAGVAGTCEGVLATASTGALRDYLTAPEPARYRRESGEA